jgi:NADH-quinone oxidoreductase subunit D
MTAGANTSEASQELRAPEDTNPTELLLESGAVLRLSEKDAAEGGCDMSDLVKETSEGAQELEPRSDTSPAQRALEQGAVLRGVRPGDDVDVELSDDETMIINMGPQHPSTHGVLRLMLELDGETVLRCKPIIGYLHTGMEKTGEDLTYLQEPTNVTRMDYASPMNNELVFALAVEALLELEIPDRAQWIRMLMSELNRMSSHLLFLATNGMDLGAISMMIYGFRDRESVLAFFEKVSGLRMNHNYIRPGGVAADLPDGWRDDVLRLCDDLPVHLDEYDNLLTGQPIWRERTQGVGVMTQEQALAISATGPILRSTGLPWDLRRTMPYLFYEQVEFDVVVGSYGDTFDRYAIRLNEIRESIRIVRQIVDRVPAGDYRAQDKKVTPPPRARIDESMEALIHHFKIFTEGYKVPEGEVYVAIESPRGELGCYIVSDGSARPYRLHIRAPSFVNRQTLPHMMRGGLVADAVAIISSVDPIMGEVDR